MKKLSTKQLIEFRRKKTDTGKRNFINRFKMGELQEEAEQEKEESKGGHYWSSGLSAIHNAFRQVNTQVIKDKRGDLEKKLHSIAGKREKDKCQKNIDILYNFEESDFRTWQPSSEMSYIKKHKEDSILTVKGIPVQILPNHIFTFKEDGIKKIGAIYFVANLKGFREGELGIYAEMLYRYLKTHYSEEYRVSPEFCIALDVIRHVDVNYAQLQQGFVPKLLIQTINDINKFM